MPTKKVCCRLGLSGVTSSLAHQFPPLRHPLNQGRSPWMVLHSITDPGGIEANSYRAAFHQQTNHQRQAGVSCLASARS